MNIENIVEYKNGVALKINMVNGSSWLLIFNGSNDIDRQVNVTAQMFGINVMARQI